MRPSRDDGSGPSCAPGAAGARAPTGISGLNCVNFRYGLFVDAISGGHRGGSFVAHGLAGPIVPYDGRTLHVTVDFEAFPPGMTDRWCFALDHWARRSSAHGIPCTFFVSVEDAARLRVEDPVGYGRFLGSLQRVHEAGSAFQPHNHRIFDIETGRQPSPPLTSRRVAGYAKQASFFYDVHHRNQIDLEEWLPLLLFAYRTLCRDADIDSPERLIFRPGGWDAGSTAGEQKRYLEALAGAGFVFHSGDSHGTYGSRDFGIETRFGENIYELHAGLAELAPCWALNCGAICAPPILGALKRLLSQPVWRSRRRRGAFVVVLHFDHLFHRGWRRSLKEFSVRAPEEIRARIDRTFVLLGWLSRVLSLAPIPLEDAARQLGSHRRVR